MVDQGAEEDGGHGEGQTRWSSRTKAKARDGGHSRVDGNLRRGSRTVQDRAGRDGIGLGAG